MAESENEVVGAAGVSAAEGVKSRLRVEAMEREECGHALLQELKEIAAIDARLAALATDNAFERVVEDLLAAGPARNGRVPGAPGSN